MSFVALALLAATPAHAGAAALEPQLRLHLGLDVIADSTSPWGATAGLDARLTRLINIDLGGFLSPISLDDEEKTALDDPRGYFHLRHGIYFTPGLRIPHAQPKSFAWDVFLRAGAGVVWTATLEPGAHVIEGSGAYPVDPAPAGCAGGDLTIRGQHVGLRLSGKAWIYEGEVRSDPDGVVLVAGQFGAEGMYQF